MPDHALVEMLSMVHGAGPLLPSSLAPRRAFSVLTFPGTGLSLLPGREQWR
jgi:hypothetical protein